MEPRKMETRHFKPALNANLSWSTRTTRSNTKLPPHILEVSALTSDVAPLLKAAQECQLDAIPEWAKPEVETRFYVDNNGQMSEDPVGPVVRAKSVGLVESAMKQFSKLTLNQIHHYATLGAYINDLYRVHKLIDVIVKINDQIFTATRHCLSCHSQVFANLFVETQVPYYAITQITMTDIDTDLFAKFLHFVHFGDMTIDQDILGPLLELSHILKSDTLRAKMMLYMSLKSDLNWGEAIIILQEKPIPFMRLAAIHSLIKHFCILLDHAMCFANISLEDMKEIISSNDLNVQTELDVFWAVLYWTISDQDKRLVHLDELMQCVRFTCMSSLELLDCARASTVMSISSTCKNLLVNAHWVCNAREMGLPDPLFLQTECPRSHLIDQPPYVPTVQEFDMRYLVYKEINVITNMDSTGDENMQKEISSRTTSEGRRFSLVFKRKYKENEKKEEKDSGTTESETNSSEGKDNKGKQKDVKDKDDDKKEKEDTNKDNKKSSKARKQSNKSLEMTHEFRKGIWRRKRRHKSSPEYIKTLLVGDKVTSNSDTESGSASLPENSKASKESNTDTVEEKEESLSEEQEKTINEVSEIPNSEERGVHKPNDLKSKVEDGPDKNGKENENEKSEEDNESQNGDEEDGPEINGEDDQLDEGEDDQLDEGEDDQLDEGEDDQLDEGEDDQLDEDEGDQLDDDGEDNQLEKGEEENKSDKNKKENGPEKPEDKKEDDDPSQEPSTQNSHNYARDTLPESRLPRNGFSHYPSAEGVLDRPDSDMSRHLHPVLQPQRVVRPSTSLNRDRDIHPSK